MTRPYANLSLTQLLDVARGVTKPASLIGIAPEPPRTPASLLAECAAAAGLATADTNTEEER